MKISYDGTTLAIDELGWKAPASCNVRNELNGKRLRGEVVYTELLGGGRGKPYYPRTFPVGTWTVLAALPKTDAYEAPFFLSTNAHQKVPIWELDQKGNYSKPAGEEAEDFGYGIHYSTSKTTLGCIRVLLKQDLLDLVDLCQKAWAKNDIVTLTVEE